jgi:hypothetical protein
MMMMMLLYQLGHVRQDNHATNHARDAKKGAEAQFKAEQKEKAERGQRK